MLCLTSREMQSAPARLADSRLTTYNVLATDSARLLLLYGLIVQYHSPGHQTLLVHRSLAIWTGKQRSWCALFRKANDGDFEIRMGNHLAKPLHQFIQRTWDVGSGRRQVGDELGGILNSFFCGGKTRRFESHFGGLPPHLPTGYERRTEKHETDASTGQ